MYWLDLIPQHEKSQVEDRVKEASTVLVFEPSIAFCLSFLGWLAIAIAFATICFNLLRIALTPHRSDSPSVDLRLVQVKFEKLSW